ARDRHAKQFSTNGLTLDVRGSAAGENLPAEIASAVLRVVLWTGGVVCAIVVLVLVFRRRSRTVPAVAQVAVTASAPAPPAHRANDDLRDALTVLRAEPTRATAVRVRALLWRMMGAEEGATLSDVLARPGALETHVRDVLRALERAAFTYDADLAAAILEASSALEAFLGRLT
ncbi:MAG: hypothetical protein JOY69_03135, partial [Candidatus Eremiobacteraeota bacterium]|nr:hypothetical protein [Candidatus Eremiobacteraeota bacterium]